MFNLIIALFLALIFLWSLQIIYLLTPEWVLEEIDRIFNIIDDEGEER